MRGYCGIGIIGNKFDSNIGTLWRSAYAMGADFIFTIGKRYKHDVTDTCRARKHIPLFNFDTYEEFRKTIDCDVVCIETQCATHRLNIFRHPEKCVYLLGAEDSGIPDSILKQSSCVIEIPSNICLNVAVAGSIVLYDRTIKSGESIND